VSGVLYSGQQWAIHRADVLRFVDDYQGERFAGIITDPPYSSGGATRGDRTATTTTKYMQTGSGNKGVLPDFEGDNRDQRSFLTWCSLWLQGARLLCEPGAPLFCFVDWRQLPTMTDAVQAGGWVWRGIVPWDKTGAVRPQLGRPSAQCEYLVYATNGPAVLWEGAPCIAGFYTQPAPRERIHITEKPVRLLRDIARLVRPDGLVFDPFVGSGAHGVGVLCEGRRYLGLELSEEIAARAAERLSAHDAGQDLSEREAGQAALFGGAA
jgi:site-specific DNA-methyltransferase (adenine-specific)